MLEMKEGTGIRILGSLSHSTETFFRGNFLCFSKFGVFKNLLLKRVSYVTCSCRNFLSHSTEKLRRGTLLCCDLENFRLRECLWISRWEEFSNSSVDYVLSHSADTIRRGNF